MGCNWSALLDPETLRPLNMLRALWGCIVYCFRGLRDLCRRVTTPATAITADRMAAFERQAGEPELRMHREFSTEAQHGSVSTNTSSPCTNSPTSDPKKFESMSQNEPVSQTLRNSPPLNGAQNPTVSEQESNGQGDQIHPNTPLLQRQGSQRPQRRHSTSFESALSSKVSGPSDKSYKTF